LTAEDRLQREIHALTAELKNAAGRTGRRRVTGAHAERARSAVAKRLRFAISRIGIVSPALGIHLNNSIRTGYNCAYLPKKPIPWSF
jgi:non-specific serine/threonine protein kinase